MAINSNPVESREAFANLIEIYKKQNPAKYELKKDALQKKLNAFPKAKGFKDAEDVEDVEDVKDVRDSKSK